MQRIATRQLRNIVVGMLAVYLALALGSCKPQEEEGQWIELPGGRMVYGTPGKPETIERLIYKIDDKRYFTMMVSEDFLTCGAGIVWYHDEGRKIKSEVGSSSVHDLPIFSMDPEKNLAIPVPNGDLQLNARLRFSTNYGKTWDSISFGWPGAGMVVKNDILITLSGSAGYQVPIHVAGAGVRSFESLKSDIKQPERENSSEDFYDFTADDFPKDAPYEFRLRYSASDTQTPDIDIDVADLIKSTPPSGWRHLRCEKMPITAERIK